jgi:tripartite ATP-independent transporter DctM subunit
MGWWEPFAFIFGGVLILLAIGMPVAFALFLTTLIGIGVTQGWGGPMQQYIFSIKSSVSTFTLLPVPLFVLMGEILWHSKIADKALDALDKLLGRLPGRISLLTVLSGTVFSSLSGSTMANTAMLGRMLVPEMHRRGYAGVMTMGPVMCSGALAMLIPPSALAVIFASVAKVSIGRLLLALIVPGLVLAASYAAFIIVAAILRPELAPAYAVRSIPLAEKLIGVVRYVLPLSIIVFLVIGVIFIGVATPTEAAALGSLGSFALALAYGGLTFESAYRAAMGTARITVMMLTILAAAIGFSQLLAYTGASRGLLEFVVAQTQSPIVFLILVQLVILVLGCFLEQIAIMLIALPVLMPIVHALAIDPIWFSVLTLINLEIALMTPPFGLLLFVMRGVVPPEITMAAICRSVAPYLAINVMVIGLILAVPSIALYFPRLVYG